MWRGILHRPHFSHIPLSSFFLASSASQQFTTLTLELGRRRSSLTRSNGLVRRRSSSSYQASGRFPAFSAGLTPLDLTEDNVKQVLADARTEFGQMFDTSVGITGEAKLAEVDGPFVKIALTGRFWHKRSTVLDRISNYLKQRIPEILEVEIEDEKQLDDSPENF